MLLGAAFTWVRKWGGKARDNHQFINDEVLNFKSKYSMAWFATFIWRLKEHTPPVLRCSVIVGWESLLEQLIDNQGMNDWWLMPDTSKFIYMLLVQKVEIKTWTVQRQFSTKLHLAVDTLGMPVRFVITQGTTANCIQVSRLIEGITVGYLLADRGHEAILLWSKLGSKVWTL